MTTTQNSLKVLGAVVGFLVFVIFIGILASSGNSTSSPGHSSHTHHQYYRSSMPHRFPSSNYQHYHSQETPTYDSSFPSANENPTRNRFTESARPTARDYFGSNSNSTHTSGGFHSSTNTGPAPSTGSASQRWFGRSSGTSSTSARSARSTHSAAHSYFNPRGSSSTGTHSAAHRWFGRSRASS